MPKNDPPKKIFLLAEGGFLPPAALGSGPYLGSGRAGRKLEKIDFSDFFFPTFRKGDCRGAWKS